MVQTQISLPLNATEHTVFVALARAACRLPCEQLRYLLRGVARQQGLSACEPTPDPDEPGADEQGNGPEGGERNG